MNKKIKNATLVNSNNIVFKSKLEESIYNTLLKLGFNPQYEHYTFTLWDSFNPVTPFYDKETTTQYNKRINIDKKNKGKILVLKTGKITGIRYTPDFYFKYNNIDVFIEAKGIENDVFYIKKKLFRKFLDNKLQKDNQHSIYFEIYTKKQLLQAIEILKDYEKSIRENTRVNTNTP